ncbi:MAG: outer membrane lipoprotein-sorting protein [Prolixibacteraceae bacterium]|nr:outer membrane lipoprotein-sorting protein [Prolixibacteraceae bacterium]
MKTLFLIAFFTLPILSLADDSAVDILKKVDKNLTSVNRVVESAITIEGKRVTRTITSKSYSAGDNKAFIEYLSPPREQGVKMLKLENQLWIYSPSTDRTIQISGHMLRQSVMGSDLSYEDMMENNKLTDVYDAQIESQEVYEGRNTYVIKLSAKKPDIAYQTQKIWVDTERFVPLKQEMYAKSGQLIKKLEMKDVVQVKGRWFPMTMVYKDMLLEGKGTEFKVTKIVFDVDIPDYIFSKASLKK